MVCVILKFRSRPVCNENDTRTITAFGCDVSVTENSIGIRTRIKKTTRGQGEKATGAMTPPQTTTCHLKFPMVSDSLIPNSSPLCITPTPTSSTTITAPHPPQKNVASHQYSFHCSKFDWSVRRAKRRTAFGLGINNNVYLN